MSLNRVVLIGRLTRDPELRTAGSGLAVCNFSIAVNRIRKDDQDADFFNVTAFGKTAEFVAGHLKKGAQVGVDGRLQQRKYTTKDGQARDVVEVLADNVQGLEKRDDGGKPAPSREVPADDDFDPFADE